MAKNYFSGVSDGWVTGLNGYISNSAPTKIRFGLGAKLGNIKRTMTRIEYDIYFHYYNESLMNKH